MGYSYWRGVLDYCVVGDMKITDEQYIELVKLNFSYDPESGIVFKKYKNNEPLGIGKSGYNSTTIKRQSMYGHRIAWILFYGVIPKMEVDHINGIPTDDRICNLRLCTHSQNLANQKLSTKNTSGYKGASFNNRIKKWTAYICVNGKTKYIGLFPTAIQAHEAWKAKAKEVFGEFFREA